MCKRAQHGDGDFRLVFNTGDSRTYRLVAPGTGPDGAPALEQLTVDHSEVQYLVSIGQLGQRTNQQGAAPFPFGPRA